MPTKRKYRYFVRYYKSEYSNLTLQEFLEAIASVGVRLQFLTYDQSADEYTTVWEIAIQGYYVLLIPNIDAALENAEKLKDQLILEQRKKK